jgi:hypothetical protein
MSGAIPLLILYAFMAWTGTTLPFTFYHGGYIRLYVSLLRTAVAQWLRYCATNRKVAGLIPDGVIGIFH